MTDNRTNEPTPEQVEAAAKALASREPMRSATAWENLHEFERKHYRDDSRAALVAAQGAAPAVSGSTSDGYHTFDELYEYRMLYNAHAAHGWLAAGIPVVKSWRHSDGEECFGGGRFIVTATLPSGQVSNHYKAKHWELFKVPEVDLPPEYDGHTPQVAAERLRAAQGAASQEVIDDAADEQDDLRLHMLAPQPACLNCDEPVAESVDGVGLRAERDVALAAIERVQETLSLHNPNGRLVKEVLAALDGAPELDRYDDFCPTCDAPNPWHTAMCAVPFRSGNSELDVASEPECEWLAARPIEGESKS